MAGRQAGSPALGAGKASAAPAGIVFNWYSSALNALRATLFGVVVWASGAGVAAGQACSHITIEPTDENASILITDSAGTCVVPDGGYVKINTVYKRFITASLSGACQTRVNSCWPSPCHCVDSFVYTRFLGTSALLVDDSNQAYVAGSPTYVQNYSTCTNPPTCTGKTNTTVGGASWITSVLGAHVYTSSTSTYSTPCQIQPQTFPQQQSITMNALKSAPKFEVTPHDVIPHLSATSISIYTGLTGQSDGGTGVSIATLIDEAAGSWTNSLSGTGASLARVQSSCGSGATCVTIHDADIGTCGGTGNMATYNTQTGEFTGNVEVVLPSDWQTFTADVLRDVLAHELGHLLGMDDHIDDECTGTADSVMTTPIPCRPIGSTVDNWQPTANDYLPVRSTVYGGGTRNACGF